jgi:hypothetical protein
MLQVTALESQSGKTRLGFDRFEVSVHDLEVWERIPGRDKTPHTSTAAVAKLAGDQRSEPTRDEAANNLKEDGENGRWRVEEYGKNGDRRQIHREPGIGFRLARRWGTLGE